MHHNVDNASIGGTLFTFCTYMMTLMDIEASEKIVLLGLGFVSAITTIVLNIKKIKKLDNNEKS